MLFRSEVTGSGYGTIVINGRSIMRQSGHLEKKKNHPPFAGVRAGGLAGPASKSHLLYRTSLEPIRRIKNNKAKNLGWKKMQFTINKFSGKKNRHKKALGWRSSIIVLFRLMVIRSGQGRAVNCGLKFFFLPFTGFELPRAGIQPLH